VRDAHALLGTRLLWVAPGWIVRPRYLVLVRDLTRPRPAVARPPGLRWSVLTDAEVPAILAADPRATAADVARRRREGQACHLCWVGGTLAHYRWEATGESYLPFLDRVVRPAPGDVFGAGLFTRPELRGRGLHALTTAVALERLREQGYRRAIAFVAWWHRPSLRVELDHAGGRVAGAVGFWNLGRGRRYFTEGAVRLEGPDRLAVDPSP
jgi:GNAT superfamily N-acetyltransferase